MEKIDLISIWKQKEGADVAAAEEELAKFRQAEAKSSGIIQQVLKKSTMEISLALLVTLISAGSCLTPQGDAWSIGFLLVSVSVVIATIVPMRIKLKNRIYAINQQDLTTSLTEYIALLIAYKKRLTIAVFVLVPAIFYVSAIILWLQSSTNTTTIIVATALSIPFLLGFLLIEFKAYVRKNYETIIEDLLNLRRSMYDDQEGNNY